MKFLIFPFLLFSQNLYANRCLNLLEAVKGLFRSRQIDYSQIRTKKSVLKEVKSVEVEMNFVKKLGKSYFDYSNLILSLLHTKDDLVSDFLKDLTDIEYNLIKGKHNLKVNKEKFLSSAWSYLDQSVKKSLIDIFSKRKQLRGETFFTSRSIEGLELETHYDLVFSKAMTLFGKKYSKGKHTVDISPYIYKEKVEYSGEGSFEDFSGIEIHFKIPGESKTFLNDLKTFFSLLNYPQTKMHIHSVYELPFPKKFQNSFDYIFSMSSVYVYSNIIAEMTSIVQKNKSLRNLKNGDAELFLVFNHEKVKKVIKYFESIFQGKSPRSLMGKNEAKMGYVSFHPSQKYDSPHDVIGYQLRSIDVDDKHRGYYETFVSKIDDYFHEEVWKYKKILQYFKYDERKSPESYVSKVLENINPHEKIKERLYAYRSSGLLSDEANSYLKDSEYLEYRYLFTPFENFEIFSKDKEWIERLKSSRLESIKEIERSIARQNELSELRLKKELRQVVSDYIVENGLLEKFYKLLEKE